MLKTVEKYATMYYSVTIAEDATPEKVAEQYYGNSDYWWIVCAINQVIDPFYDWVMRETEVYEYVNKIYDDQDEMFVLKTNFLSMFYCATRNNDILQNCFKYHCIKIFRTYWYWSGFIPVQNSTP